MSLSSCKGIQCLKKTSDNVMLRKTHMRTVFPISLRGKFSCYQIIDFILKSIFRHPTLLSHNPYQNVRWYNKEELYISLGEKCSIDVQSNNILLFDFKQILTEFTVMFLLHISCNFAILVDFSLKTKQPIYKNFSRVSMKSDLNM